MRKIKNVFHLRVRRERKKEEKEKVVQEKENLKTKKLVKC